MTKPTTTSVVIIDDTAYETYLNTKFRRRKPYQPADPTKVRCHIPGVIQKIFVRQGQKVDRGDPLLILEAMKMQNNIVSPLSGKVAAVLVYEGQMATKGQILVELAIPGSHGE